MLPSFCNTVIVVDDNIQLKHEFDRIINSGHLMYFDKQDSYAVANVLSMTSIISYLIVCKSIKITSGVECYNLVNRTVDKSVPHNIVVINKNENNEKDGVSMKICKVSIDQEAIKDLEQLLQKTVYDTLSSASSSKLSLVDFRCSELGDKNFFSHTGSSGIISSVTMVHRKISLDTVKINWNGEIDIENLKKDVVRKLENMIAADYHKHVSTICEIGQRRLATDMFDSKPFKVVLENLPKLDIKIDTDNIGIDLYFSMGTSIISK